MAPGLDDSPLVKGEGAEAARAEAAPAGDQAELHLRDGRHAAQLFVAGVVGPGVGQVVDVVHLLLGKGLLGRVLHHEEVGTVGLDEPLGGERVGVAGLDAEALGVASAVLYNLVVAGQRDGLHRLVRLPAGEDGAVDPGDVPGVHSAVEGVGDLHHGPLTHAVHQKIGLGVQQDGALALAGPVVVVG